MQGVTKTRVDPQAQVLTNGGKWPNNGQLPCDLCRLLMGQESTPKLWVKPTQTLQRSKNISASMGFLAGHFLHCTLYTLCKSKVARPHCADFKSQRHLEGDPGALLTVHDSVSFTTAAGP